MPELPDVSVYREALEQRIVRQRLEKVLLQSPFLLRTVEPPIESALGRHATEVRRIGKRLGPGLEGETNYCATCQTGGRLLADRALSRLLKQDWPKTVDGFDRDE
jgi:formamidopyrimidine-DNA glycosylase